MSILDRPNVVTARSPLVIWEVGTGGIDDVTPSPATVYVDDAADWPGPPRTDLN